MSTANLVVIVPQDLASGFRLAGADTRVVDDTEDAGQTLDDVLREGERGVVAVYEPYLEKLAPDRRRQLEMSVSPVVVALPTGVASEGEGARRARLVARLQRAIGYHITFGEEET